MRAILWTGAAGVAAALAFLLWPRLDIVVAREFVSNGRFWLQYDAVASVINRSIPVLVYGAIAALVALTALRLVGRPVAGMGYRATGFLALSLIVGPGLIVNSLLKPFSGRPRPFQTTPFGGDASFEPAFHFDGACHNNCSFVSGDASAAVALFAVALLLRRGRGVAIAGALAFGACIGIVRMAQGAHFLSDVVFAGFVTVLPILVLYHVLIERGWPRTPIASRSFRDYWKR